MIDIRNVTMESVAEAIATALADNGLGDASVAPGRVEVPASDPLAKVFRPSREAVAAIETNEQANAQGLAVLHDMMMGHVLNWPEPKRFGTAVSLIDKALATAIRDRRELLAFAESVASQKTDADTGGDMSGDEAMRVLSDHIEDARALVKLVGEGK